MAVAKPQYDTHSTPKSVIERDRRIHDPPPSSLKAGISSCTPIPLAKQHERPMLLMEALAAGDTASMSASLPLAGERKYTQRC